MSHDRMIWPQGGWLWRCLDPLAAALQWGRHGFVWRMWWLITIIWWLITIVKMGISRYINVYHNLIVTEITIKLYQKKWWSKNGSPDCPYYHGLYPIFRQTQMAYTLGQCIQHHLASTWMLSDLPNRGNEYLRAPSPVSFQTSMNSHCNYLEGSSISPTWFIWVPLFTIEFPWIISNFVK